MIHKITRQYIKQCCKGEFSDSATRVFVLDSIVTKLVKMSNYLKLVNIRTDMYLYDELYSTNPDTTHSIEKCYILLDSVSGMYLYVFCTSDSSRRALWVTTSKQYDASKNILRQEGSPKYYGRVSSPNVRYYKYECYGFLLLIGMELTTIGDIYITVNGRSFSIIVDNSYASIGRYDNETASYLVYDASSPYHSSDKRIFSIHSSYTELSRTGASQKDVVADTFYIVKNMIDKGAKYASLVFVPCDIFDTGEGGYYTSASSWFVGDYGYKIRILRYNDSYYVCDSDVLLRQPNLLGTVTRVVDLPRNEFNKQHGDPLETYETPNFRDMILGDMVSYFAGYELRRDYQTPTAAEIMYRTNSDFNYLDTNSGTNYYSGMLSTLNSSTVAIPNFVSVMREPVGIGTMSPVQESTFMYLVDMSKIQTGEVVEVIDNRGNKIKLICFPTHMGEIKPPGDKLFGVGFRFEDVVQTEDYLNIDGMEANSGKSVMTLLNAKNRVSAYLGDVDFKDYQRGTILLNYSYRNVETIEIAYSDMDGDYIQKVSWTARDFIDRMESGETFDLLRSNNNGDYWYINPIKSTDTVLVSGLRNCGIVSISCNRRK